MATGVATYSDLPKGAQVVGYSDLPEGATVVSGAKPDPLMQQTQAAARAAGVGAPAPQPLAQTMQPMSRAGAFNPLETLPEYRLANPQETEQQAKDSAMSMAWPIGAMTVGALGPIGGIAREGLGGYAANLGRGALKSIAGSEIGRYGGRAIGSIFGKGGAETGGEVGGALGSIAGPLVGGETFAKLPFGMGRLVATDEETAAARAGMKVAQRNADIAAGLRKPLDQPSALGKIGAQDIGSESVAGTRPRSLVLTPEEASSEERMQGIAKKRASERGMQFAAGMTPREGRSVPRGPSRMESTEYPGPRETIGFGPQGSPLGTIGSSADVAYRAHPVGEADIPSANYPQATMSREHAEQYARDMEEMTGKPHTVSEVDLSKTPHRVVPGPRGVDWVVLGGGGKPN